MNIGLKPSETTNSFTFGNYFRKKNFSERIVYNGNASFFLEPLEATSIGVINRINRMAYDIWVNGLSQNEIEEKNTNYIDYLTEIERMIMLHYYAGSIYNTPFWDHAKDLGLKCMIETKNDSKFKEMLATVIDLETFNGK